MSFLLADSIPYIDAERLTVLAIAAVAVAGLLAGLLYKAGAAIVLSFVAMLVTLATTLAQGWLFWQSALAAFGLMMLLQIGYLAGVALGIAAQKLRSVSAFRSVAALFKRNTAG